MIPPCLSSAPEGYNLRPVTLNLVDRNEFPVRNIHLATDGDPNTYADSSFWGAGQGVQEVFKTPLRIGAARLIANVYEGDGGHCTMVFGGGPKLKINQGEGKRSAHWKGDVIASMLDVVEYPRTHIYEIQLWEIVPMDTKPPRVITLPVAPVVPENEAQVVADINSGEALGNQLSASVADGDFTFEFSTTNAQIERWQALQLTDPGNGNTKGTLGYFAVSARDFWSQIGDLFDVGAPPSAIQEQFQIWSSYSASQAGKDFADMQPIDLWFEANN